LAGSPFTRERLLTAVAGEVGKGAGDPAGDGGLVDYLGERDRRLCDLIACLLGSAKGDVLGLNPDQLKRCLEEFCKPAPHRTHSRHEDGVVPVRADARTTMSASMPSMQHAAAPAAGQTPLVQTFRSAPPATDLNSFMRLEEGRARPRPVPMVMKHGPGEEMFGLSNADLAAAGLPLRQDSPPMDMPDAAKGSDGDK
jgi:hypothetical protein